MVRSLSESGRVTRDKVLEHTRLWEEAYMKDNLMLINSMEWVNIPGLMRAPMKDNG